MLSEEILNDIFYVFPETLIIVDESSEIVFANHMAELLFKKSKEKLIHRHILSALNLSDHNYKQLSYIIKERKNATIYNVDIGEEHNVQSIKYHLRVFVIGRKEPFFTLLLMPSESSDAMKKALIHQRANESLSSLSRVFKKNLKNPLTSILSAAQFLEKNYKDPHSIEMTQIIQSEGKNILHFVRSIEDIEHYVKGDNTSINMHEVLQEAKDRVRNMYTICPEFEEIYDPSLPELWGNKEQLTYLFVHLIRNAVEATEHKKDGRIILKSYFSHSVMMSSRFIASEKLKNNLNIVFSVADNGKGIEEDFLPQLFLPFATTKLNKKGLGLAMVSAIADNHNGIVEYERISNMTHFRVLLPSYIKR